MIVNAALFDYGVPSIYGRYGVTRYVFHGSTEEWLERLRAEVRGQPPPQPGEFTIAEQEKWIETFLRDDLV